MGKQEFLEKLRMALNGKVAPGVVTENVNYYEDYINTEIRKGRSEEEILNGLGDPRLIARTIVETHGGGNPGAGHGNAQSRRAGQSYEQTAHRNENSGHYESSRRTFRVPGWLLLILGMVILALVFSVVFSVLSVLLPPILLILLIVFLVKLFRDWIN